MYSSPWFAECITMGRDGRRAGQGSRSEGLRSDGIEERDPTASMRGSAEVQRFFSAIHMVWDAGVFFPRCTTSLLARLCAHAMPHPFWRRERTFVWTTPRRSAKRRYRFTVILLFILSLSVDVR
jgi:hypothetical protein